MPRTINDIVSPLEVLEAMQSVMSPNTALAAANGSTMVDTRVPMYGATASYPAIVIEEGPQSTARIYWKLWQTKITVLVTYYDRWDQQQNTIDEIWANIDADLRRMKANLEDNPRLFVGSTRNALDITLVTLSPFRGNLTDKDYPFPLAERMMSVQVNIQPYTSAN